MQFLRVVLSRTFTLLKPIIVLGRMQKAALDFSTVPWRRMPVLKSEIRLDITLKCGQSFRWAQHESTIDQWIGVLRGKLWLLSQDAETIMYKSFPAGGDDDEALLKDYFQLNVKLLPLYQSWSKIDPIFEKIAQNYTGVRMLRQDPVENLFSFICSSNNNIQRISSMVENLCTHYGERICQIKTKTFFSFPTVSRLAANSSKVEHKLRSLGFGYRAAYIAKTAAKIEAKGGEEYLFGLRNLGFEEARKELLQLTGVGPKVADCILLMSLDKPSAVPVDTHMYQIAATKYLPHLKGYKSITDKVYKEIADHFRKLYGEHAGWAHSVLFSADLKHLQAAETSKQDQAVTKKRKSTSAIGSKSCRNKHERTCQ